MRIIALDYGRKRVGIAITDPLGIIAQPLLTIENVSQKALLKRLKFIIEENSVGLILLGNPLAHNGKETLIGQEVMRFAKKLETATQVKVQLWDERFTSQYALKSLKDIGLRRKHVKVDQVAASIILNEYLKSQTQGIV